MNNRGLCVAIEAQIKSGSEGGMEQVLIGLCHGLAETHADHHDECVIVGHWQGSDWIAPYIGRGMRYVTPPPPQGQFGEKVKDLFGPLRRPLGIARRALKSAVASRNPGTESVQEPPESDGFYESLGVDMLHITYPLNFVRSSIPTIVTMCDLQHRHLPEFFPPKAMQWRDAIYPRIFDQAEAIITIARFCKDDIVNHYGVIPSKVQVVPLASPFEAYPPTSESSRGAVIRKYGLTREFMLYPALTYPHKNHVRLLEAVALLRNEHLCPLLVCTGTQRHHWPIIEQRIRDLDLADHVRFLGFVSVSELTAIFDLAQFVVLPSLFEGAGLPLLEAFRANKAVACSDITAFREYGGEAPLFFDPIDRFSIADAIRAIATSADLRATLALRGSQRGAEFSWSRTARLHRAVYRKVAGQGLSSEEIEC
jgi:glycosyltransferase involved in cell wall biosynthesis